MKVLRWTLVAVVGAAVLHGCGSSSGPAPAPGRWERLADPPLTGRVGAVVAGVGRHVVVVGGWERLCPPLAECVFPDLPLLADGAVLDLTTGDWKPIAPAPYGVRDAATAVVGHRLYLLSGCRQGPHCEGPQRLLRYDVERDRWQQLADPGPGLRHASLVRVGGSLLALSTSDEHGAAPDALYDPATDSWQRLPDDPLPRTFDRFAVADGQRVLVFGSPISDDPEAEAQPKTAAAYDLATGRWTRLPDAPTAGYQVWRSGREAWLNPHFGPGGGAVLDLRTDAWRSYPELPDATAYDLAGIVGDGTATYEYDAGWVRDTRGDRWIEIRQRPGGVEEASMSAAGEALVVFGGQRWDGGDGALVGEAWVWHPPGG